MPWWQESPPSQWWDSALVHYQRCRNNTQLCWVVGGGVLRNSSCKELHLCCSWMHQLWVRKARWNLAVWGWGRMKWLRPVLDAGLHSSLQRNESFKLEQSSISSFWHNPLWTPGSVLPSQGKPLGIVCHVAWPASSPCKGQFLKSNYSFRSHW